eukprot:scaffold197550_cov31-Tisochrysis_lutea.AAC.5
MALSSAPHLLTSRCAGARAALGWTAAACAVYSKFRAAARSHWKAFHSRRAMRPTREVCCA